MIQTTMHGSALNNPAVNRFQAGTDSYLQSISGNRFPNTNTGQFQSNIDEGQGNEQELQSNPAVDTHSVDESSRSDSIRDTALVSNKSDLYDSHLYGSPFDANIPNSEAPPGYIEATFNEGQAEEAVLAGSASAMSAAAMAVPMLNQNIAGEINSNQMEMARKGLGDFGTSVGHEIVDQQNFANKNIAATVGSGLMFAGLATGDPLLGAAGIATGIAAETIMPMAMQNSSMVQSTSGNLVSPT